MVTHPIPIMQRMPHSELERQLINDYLREKGYSLNELKNLPEEESHRLRVEACSYASLKLAEIEARARFRHRIKFED